MIIVLRDGLICPVLLCPCPLYCSPQIPVLGCSWVFCSLAHPPQGWTYCVFWDAFHSCEWVFIRVTVGSGRCCHSPLTSLISKMFLPAELMLTWCFFGAFLMKSLKPACPTSTFMPCWRATFFPILVFVLILTKLPDMYWSDFMQGAPATWLASWITVWMQ